MPHDGFEDRLRAFAEQLSRSISDVDLDDVADRLGVDRDRVQGAAGAVGEWLQGQSASHEPLFGPERRADGAAPGEPTAGGATPPSGTLRRASGGPHPLDLPTEAQGRALSALASGRWTLEPGSVHLSSAGAPIGLAPPPDADLTGELRARDWITADGSVTLVGRHALTRWCRTAETSNDADTGAATPNP